ncbi:MAG: hypothetical protein AAGI52_03550 [Bacteroidota bacterium]
MTPSPFPLVLAILGTVVYHLAQKSVPESAAPFAVIAMAYLVGFVCAVGAVLVSGAPVAETARVAWKPAVALGLGALTIEVGYLLAYRVGWPVSTVSLIANVAVAAVLLIVGLAVYREALSAAQWAGMACCAVGLALLFWR